MVLAFDEGGALDSADEVEAEAAKGTLILMTVEVLADGGGVGSAWSFSTQDDVELLVLVEEVVDEAVEQEVLTFLSQSRSSQA